MTAALDKLAYYFGTIGIASVVAWLVAVALMALYVVALRRSLVCWPALAVAIVGLVLANINSNNVSAIRMDFSEDIRAAKQRAAEEAAADRTPAESDVSEEAEKAKQAEAAEKDNEPAEGEQPSTEEVEKSENAARSQKAETPGNDHDPAEGDATDAADSEREPAEEPAAAEPRHDYRQRGKVQRAEGMEVEGGEKIPIGPGTEDQPVVQNFRMMKRRSRFRLLPPLQLDVWKLLPAPICWTAGRLHVSKDTHRVHSPGKGQGGEEVSQSRCAQGRNLYLLRPPGPLASDAIGPAAAAAESLLAVAEV